VTGVQTCALPIYETSHPLFIAGNQKHADPKRLIFYAAKPALLYTNNIHPYKYVSKNS
jgi:hypothetical protein